MWVCLSSSIHLSFLSKLWVTLLLFFLKTLLVSEANVTAINNGSQELSGEKKKRETK